MRERTIVIHYRKVGETRRSTITIRHNALWSVSIGKAGKRSPSVFSSFVDAFNHARNIISEQTGARP